MARFARPPLPFYEKGKGCGLSDSALFISGSLFTTDYLVEAVSATPAYLAVDVAALRTRLDAIATAFPQNLRTNESQTEDDFIWPVLGALGWSESLRQQNLTVLGRDDVPDGLLFADAEAKAAANAHDDQWRRYAHGLAIVESKRWARPLDRASGRDEATAPSTQMLRYLRRIDDLTSGKLRWGILTNGKRWRLYWAGARSVSEEFLEIDLGRVLALDGGDDLFASDADRDHWLRVFAVMFSRGAFLKDGADDRSFHERARAAAAFYEERVAASLSKLVFEQVFPSLAGAIAKAAPEAPLQDVREASLVLLYRLLFLLYAEDRDLLPVSDKRYDDYALRPLRIDVGKRVSEGDALSSSASRIWGHIADLSRIIDKGDVSVGIPPYNGGLFAGDGAALLESVRIPDSVMAPTLDALSYERSSGERRYINYRDLSVQQLGSIYERLLEFEIVRDDAGALAVRPNLFARKSTGSYYTPDELVGLILDETLEPLITERVDAFRATLGMLNPKDAEDYQRRELRDADPANAILSLRVGSRNAEWIESADEQTVTIISRNRSPRLANEAKSVEPLGLHQLCGIAAECCEMRFRPVVEATTFTLFAIEPAAHVLERDDDAGHGVMRQELIGEVTEVVVRRQKQIELQALKRAISENGKVHDDITIGDQQVVKEGLFGDLVVETGHENIGDVLMPR